MKLSPGTTPLGKSTHQATTALMGLFRLLISHPSFLIYFLSKMPLCVDDGVKRKPPRINRRKFLMDNEKKNYLKRKTFCV